MRPRKRIAGHHMPRPIVICCQPAYALLVKSISSGFHIKLISHLLSRARGFISVVQRPPSPFSFFSELAHYLRKKRAGVNREQNKIRELRNVQSQEKRYTINFRLIEWNSRWEHKFKFSIEPYVIRVGTRILLFFAAY